MVVASVIYIKLEWVDDVYSPYEDRLIDAAFKYRRAGGIICALAAIIFMVSVTALSVVQTGNLLKGETTCERFA